MKDAKAAALGAERLEGGGVGVGGDDRGAFGVMRSGNNSRCLETVALLMGHDFFGDFDAASL